ncbi:MAG: sodium:proton antiporter [Oscillospiraceae bacterium]|nr:sodium:proton antiporter [Oscillospiraceae bacterium]
MTIEQAYQTLYTAALLVIAVLLAVMLVRCAREPGITDRVLSINMIGTLVTAGIVILSQLLKEGFLVDVALIYTMISFVSILILVRVYVPENPERRPFWRKDEEGDERNG